MQSTFLYNLTLTRNNNSVNRSKDKPIKPTSNNQKPKNNDNEKYIEMEFEENNSENEEMTISEQNNPAEFGNSREENDNLLRSDEDDDDDGLESNNKYIEEINHVSPEKSRNKVSYSMDPKNKSKQKEDTIDPSANFTYCLNDPLLNTKVSFNVVVNWGEEWKLCKGDAYPESVAALEGELDVPASDFENLLTAEEKQEFYA